MLDWIPVDQEKVLGNNPRITILNTIIDVLNVQETIDLVEEYVKRKEPLHLMGVNADKINELNEKGLIAGKTPAGVAAAALYYSSRVLGERRTQKEIASVVGVTEVTIRTRYKEMTKGLNLN